MRINKIEWPELVYEISCRVRRAGGNSMVVGGTVLDLIEGREPRDWDIEVYGMTVDALEIVLEEFNPKRCGKSFAVIKVSRDGYELDISIPFRKSPEWVQSDICRRNGGVPYDHLDPSMSPEEAAERRDFTINSMAIPIGNASRYGTHQLIDPFDGMKDWKKKILRVISKDTFSEDPLRGLRAMQLSARKASGVLERTVDIVRSIEENTFSNIPRERFLPEWEKLLLLSDKPSIGLKFLDDCGWLRFYPELWEMAYWSGWEQNAKWRSKFDAGCPQNPEWHPEGNVWVHTLKVVDEAARVRHKMDEEWRLPFMFAALLHDVAKPETTLLPRCTAYSHEAGGERLTRKFLRRMTVNDKLINRTVSLVVNHLQPHSLHADAKPSAWKRLHGKVRLDVLGWLSRADWAGRGGRKSIHCDTCELPSESVYHRGGGDLPAEHIPSKLCFEWFKELGKEPIEPKLKGRHLIERGMEPGPTFKRILDAAYECQLENPYFTIAELFSRATDS